MKINNAENIHGVAMAISPQQDRAAQVNGAGTHAIMACHKLLPSIGKRAKKSQRGFTLIELMTSLALIAILSSFLLPGLNTAKSQARSLLCKVNAAALTRAWTLYSYDNGDKLIPNSAGAIDFDQSWLPGNAQRTITAHTVERSLLFDYETHHTAYRCPEDRGVIQINHRSYPRAVSYGLNIYLNGSLGPKPIKDWLGHSAVTLQSEIRSPSDTLAFIGEDPAGNSGTQFVYYPEGINRWISFPSDLHAQGCNPSFSDGHVEHWSWEAEKTNRWKSGIPIPVDGPQDQSDLLRIQKTIPE